MRSLQNGFVFAFFELLYRTPPMMTQRIPDLCFRAAAILSHLFYGGVHLGPLRSIAVEPHHVESNVLSFPFGLRLFRSVVRGFNVPLKETKNGLSQIVSDFRRQIGAVDQISKTSEAPFTNRAINRHDIPLVRHTALTLLEGVLPKRGAPLRMASAM